jgi:hypothetical protein
MLIDSRLLALVALASLALSVHADTYRAATVQRASIPLSGCAE